MNLQQRIAAKAAPTGIQVFGRSGFSRDSLFETATVAGSVIGSRLELRPQVGNGVGNRCFRAGSAIRNDVAG